MRKIVITSVLFSLLLSSSFLHAADLDPNPVYTAVPSLSITPEARAGGMGDVGVATLADVNSQYWNPAKYLFTESDAGLSLSFTPWMRNLVSDIDLAYVAGYKRFGDNQAISASLRYFSLGKVTLTTIDGTNYNDVQPNEFSFDVAYSRLLSKKWSAAVALRFIYSDLSGGMVEDLFPGISVAADIAAFYNTPITFASGDGNFGFGLNVSNIGAKISYDNNESNLFIPTNMRLGASFLYPIDNYQTISISADVNKLLVPTPPKQITGMTDDEYNALVEKYEKSSVISAIFNSFTDAPGGFQEELQEIMWSVGVEYVYNKQFFVRGGYFNEHQNKGNRKYFTAGVGFKMNVFTIDAGYVISLSPTNPLDKTLRFSLSFDLEGLKNLKK